MKPTAISEFANLGRLVEALQALGATRAYAKVLSENDNSKNQIYLGGDFSALNLLPFETPRPSHGNEDHLKAPITLSWFDADGRVERAPSAQLILYPQYPEVRLSGFLRGCGLAPSDLLTKRATGRVLFLGVRPDGGVLAHAVPAKSPVATEFQHATRGEPVGVFEEVLLGAGGGSRVALLRALGRVHRLGWIDSKRLQPDGKLTKCKAQHCGGYTLEAELGIRPNGYAEPDYLGWEIKQYAVRDFVRYAAKSPITLLTPEPDGGIYVADGVEAFVRRFGRESTKRPDRLDFVGRHKYGKPCPSTHMVLRIEGFDVGSRRISDAGGSIVLASSDGDVAMRWSFPALMHHWNRKHARAAYVPSQVRDEPKRQYRYAGEVRLGEGTDFTRLLAAVATGLVCYDPAIKLEDVHSRKPKPKRRSQFRIGAGDLAGLYGSLATAGVLY